MKHEHSPPRFGMLMDDVSGVLIASPLTLPIVRDRGGDPIQFATIIGVNLGMGNITPRRHRRFIWGHGSGTLLSTRC